MCCTFAFISSSPTVATVLACCLFLFSSFCGLSIRCSRCLITWIHPEYSSREEERGEMREGDKRHGRVRSLFTMMSALQLLALIFIFILYSYMFGTQQAAGLKGIQLRQEIISRSALVACPQHKPERILVSPAWKLNKTLTCRIYDNVLPVFRFSDDSA